MNRSKNNFFFIVSFFLLSTALFSQTPSLRLQSQRINSDFVLLKNEILHLDFSSVKIALQNGVAFHIDFTWEFHNTLELKPSQFFYSSLVLSYNNINQSYMVTEAMFVLPFQTFEKMLDYVTRYQRYARIKKSTNDYQCRITVKGYALKFFFPINLIYRALIDSGDFSLKSNWYVMEDKK